MKKIHKLFIAILFLYFTFFIVFTLVPYRPVPHYDIMEIHGKEWNITQLAENDTTWQQGLMNQTITNNTMMLFVFPSEGIYSFWMKNTLAPLDMIWIDIPQGNNGIIVSMASNTTPCPGENDTQCMASDYIPDHPANFVLETQAGFIKQNNLSIGTNVSLREMVIQ